MSVTLFGDAAGSSALPVDRVDSIATGGTNDSPLIVLDAARKEVSVLSRSPSGAMESTQGPIDLRGADVGQVTGLDLDPVEQAVVLVDAVRSRLLRIGLEELVRGSRFVGQVSGACEIHVPDIAESEPILLAVRPTDGHIFLATPGGGVLNELDRDGQAIRELDFGDLALDSIRDMAFAPSADPTDADDVLHLYILASGRAGSRIHALSFSPPPTTPSTVPQLTGTIVSRISTSTLSPPSSDPGGIAYDAEGERFIVTDSDIDELPEFAAHVVFGLEPDQQWQGMGQPGASEEITDVAIDPDSPRWFFTDDRQDVIIQVEPGDDRLFATRDDNSSVISTEAFGNFDPEGITFGQDSLFVTDGVAAEVFRLTPGEDGVFTGVPPIGDDEIASFDTAALGISDPEGIAYDADRGSLFLRSRPRREPIIEVATDGTLLTVVAIDRDELISPGGLALGPSLDGSGRLNLFIADRGEDNARSGTPNDGQILEVQFERAEAAGLRRSRAALPPPPTGPA